MHWGVIIPLIALLSFFGEEERSFHQRVKLSCRLFLVILLAYISGFGSPSAQDHLWYAIEYQFVDIKNISNLTYHFGKTNEGEWEVGYLLLNYFGKFLRLGEAGFFFMIGLIINYSAVNYIFKYKNATITIIYLFISLFLVQQGNLVRQSLASAVILYSIFFLKNKQIKTFLIWVFIATCFHASSFILLSLAPLCFLKGKLNEERIIRLLLSIIWILSILFYFKLLNIPFIKTIAVLTSYDNYMSTENGVGMEFSFLRICIFNFITIFGIIFLPYKYIVNIVLLVFYTLLMNMTSQIPNLIRLTMYFGLANITFICNFLSDKEFFSGRLLQLQYVLKTIVIIYLVFTVINDFIFNENVLLCKEMYSWSDFFAK